MLIVSKKPVWNSGAGSAHDESSQTNDKKQTNKNVFEKTIPFSAESFYKVFCILLWIIIMTRLDFFLTIEGSPLQEILKYIFNITHTVVKIK